MFHRSRGFSLIELMLVVAIMAIIAAVAIPTLMSSRMGAQIQATRAILRTVTSGEQTYFATQGVFTDFVTLEALEILDDRFSSNSITINAYTITISVTGTGSGFSATATPLMAGAPTFTVDETYEIVES